MNREVIDIIYNFHPLCTGCYPVLTDFYVFIFCFFRFESLLSLYHHFPQLMYDSTLTKTFKSSLKISYWGKDWKFNFDSYLSFCLAFSPLVLCVCVCVAFTLRYAEDRNIGEAGTCSSSSPSTVRETYCLTHTS